jgi:hypothetical protein
MQSPVIVCERERRMEVTKKLSVSSGLVVACKAEFHWQLDLGSSPNIEINSMRFALHCNQINRVFIRSLLEISCWDMMSVYPAFRWSATFIKNDNNNNFLLLRLLLFLFKIKPQ